LFQFFSNKPHSYKKIQWIFISGPSQSNTHHIIFSYLINLNLVNDKHSELEVSDFSKLTVHFNGTVAETASSIHILHNHNLWRVLSCSKGAKAMSLVTM
jgi:hypothetical protein